MRKLIAAALVTVSLAAVTAATAGAQVASRFSVQTVNTHPLHGSGNIQTGRLAVPDEDADAGFVGRFFAKFTSQTHVKAIAKFQDEGTIKFAGNFGNNNRLQILGGSGEFNGASGKVKVHNIGGGEVILTFTVVQ